MKIEKVVCGTDRMKRDDLACLYGGDELMANSNHAWRCKCSGSGDNDNTRYRCICGDGKKELGK